MKKVFLAGRGGGVKSTVLIGTLEVLHDRNYEIVGYSGTSISSVVMSLAATGLEYQEIRDLFLEWVVAFSNANRLKGGKGSKIIQDSVDATCKKMTFGNLKKPLYIVANSGSMWKPKMFLFSKETTPNVTLGEACRASCSFPIAYEHYKTTLEVWHELPGKQGNSVTTVENKKLKFWDGGMIANPYFPKNFDYTGVIKVCASFRKDKVNLKSRYVHAWQDPEKEADILLLPYVGKMGSFGTPIDIETAYVAGYKEAKKKL